MAYIARLSRLAKGAVAGQTIQEGRLVSLTSSGLYNDLPTALLAASGVYKNVYVAIVPPDNFARPTPAVMYTARDRDVIYESTGWSNAPETGPFYHEGLSTLENPFLASGYILQAHTGVTVTVPSGCTVPTSNLQVVGNLVKVSDDGTGRFEYTTNQAIAIGVVEDYDPALQTYTFEVR